MLESSGFWTENQVLPFRRSSHILSEQPAVLNPGFCLSSCARTATQSSKGSGTHMTALNCFQSAVRSIQGWALRGSFLSTRQDETLLVCMILFVAITKMIAEKLNINRQSVGLILTENFLMRKVCKTSANLIILVKKILTSKLITILEHPLYSLDLSPCNLFILSAKRNHMREKNTFSVNF